MKNKMILFGLTISLCLTACNDWLTIRPESEIEKNKLYETEEGFWHATNGVYTLCNKLYGPVGAMQSTTIEYLGNVWLAPTNDSRESRLREHQYKAADVDDLMKNIFLQSYNIIANANTVLSYLENEKVLPERSHNLIKGEMLGMRAMIHFDLMRMWGPMPGHVDERTRYLPYVVEVSKKENKYSTYEEYMTRLLADLDESIILLEKEDPLTKYSCAQLNKNGGAEYDRLEWYWRQNKFNYYAALGLKARIKLWMGEKNEAYRYAKEVIEAKNADDTPKFRLGTASDIDVNFSGGIDKKATNTLKAECLFAYPDFNFNSDGYFKSNYYNLVENFSQLFDDKNDFRFKLCRPILPDEVTGREKYMTTYKYVARYDNWMPRLRLAEMYLIMMECAPLAEANDYYKKFCQTRGIAYKEFTEAMRTNILKTEYYKEFIGEGQIFFMYKRFGVENMLWSTDNTYESQYVLPLPKRETEVL